MRIQKSLKNSLKISAQRKPSTISSRRARNIARKRVVHARAAGCSKRRRSSSSNSVKCSKEVSDKLEALKSLIPQASNGSNDMVKAEQLFQQTADYIIVLKTQVFVLQKFIDFYDGSRDHEKQIVPEKPST